jgi:hypothetical protein
VYVVWSHTIESSIEIQKEFWTKEVKRDFTEFVSILTYEPIGVYLFMYCPHEAQTLPTSWQNPESQKYTSDKEHNNLITLQTHFSFPKVTTLGNHCVLYEVQI